MRTASRMVLTVRLRRDQTESNITGWLLSLTGREMAGLVCQRDVMTLYDEREKDQRSN